MPKPKKYNRHDWSGERDFTDFSKRINRRVTFKNSKVNQRKQDLSSCVRAHLEDEDIDIDMAQSSGASSKYNRRRRFKSPVPKGSHEGRRILFEGPTNWYRVVLPHGNKYDKVFILNQLQDVIAPLSFVPVAWSTSGNQAVFYVDDFKIASRLNDSDKLIDCPDGFKLFIRVSHGLPHIEINAAYKNAMKMAMVKRYNSITKALDLTKFHIDPDLSEHFCALFKPSILLAAIDVVAENISDLVALNLNDNRISTLDNLSSMPKKLPNLKILYLGKNNLRHIKQLDALKGVVLDELLLDGNPLCNRFKDKNLYISEVRKRFPKVIKLDGVDLPPPILFDVAEDLSLPESKRNFLCAAEGQEIVRQFLEQYFILYDGGSRMPLLQAYHEHAVLSLTSAYPYGQNSKNSSFLNRYFNGCRDLLRITSTEGRNKLLHKGPMDIVKFLNDLPRTQHDIHSFTVDLSLFTPPLMMLSVTGIFKELESGQKVAPIRSFSRALVIVPTQSGFCIANELLHITNATEAQQKNAFKTPVMVPTPAPATATAVTPADPATREQMVQVMSQQSGMNLEWSRKCLEETMWDFQRATEVFTQLHASGTIPPEAFIKL